MSVYLPRSLLSAVWYLKQSSKLHAELTLNQKSKTAQPKADKCPTSHFHRLIVI